MPYSLAILSQVFSGEIKFPTWELETNNQRKEILPMVEKQSFMRAEDVAKELEVSVSHAYKIMRKLNAELKAQGYMTIASRVNRKFFMEKFCYGGVTGKE